MILTIDASVVAKWFFDEPFKENAKALIELPYRFSAPDLLVYEFTSIVRKNTRHQKISNEEGLETLKRFHSLPIHLITANQLYEQAYRIANDLDHHVYDSFYLAIPVIWGGVMVTADRKLFNKVKESPYTKKIAWIEEPLNTFE